MATKIFPFTAGAHEAANLERGLRDALAALKASSVDIFYLHAPDRSTPFEKTVEAVNNLYNEGLFERVRDLGVHMKHGHTAVCGCSFMLTLLSHYNSLVYQTLQPGRLLRFTSSADIMAMFFLLFTKAL